MVEVKNSQARGSISLALAWLPQSTRFRGGILLAWALYGMFSPLNRTAAIRMVTDTHSFYQVIVRDLRKQMMNHMRSNIMVNVVNPSIVAIKCRKPSPQITPFLSNTWREIPTFYMKKAKLVFPQLLFLIIQVSSVFRNYLWQLVTFNYNVIINQKH